MPLTRRILLAAGFAAPAIVRAQASTPIRIGEINSYTAVPAFTLPYRNGWQLAVAQLNDAGGVLGRKLEVISRDDAGQPQTAVRLAGELMGDSHADLLAGGFLSNIGLAISDFAVQNKALYIGGEPLADALVWEKGNANTFRLRPSTYMQVAMLVEQAAKLPAKRWVTVAPNYEYGQSSVKWFKQMMAKARPDVTFAAEQWPALGKLDAGPTVAALEQAQPDGIFNVLFGGDLTSFVRAGNTRGLFEKRSVVSLLTGEPEYLDPLGEETPEGWLVTGLSLGAAEHAGQHQVRRRLPRDVQGPAAHGLRGGLLTDPLHRRRFEARRWDGVGGDGKGVRGRLVRDAVRRCGVSRDRPPKHARRLRGQDGAEGRAWHHGRLALRGRRHRDAVGRFRAGAASGVICASQAPS